MSYHTSTIEQIIQASIKVKQHLLQEKEVIQTIDDIVGVVVKAYQNGGKVFFCGNGGSAADAQHLAAELSARFYMDRDPLYAEALHVNTSYLTATANDYSFEVIYSRLIEAKAKQGDVLFGLSTSGNSANVVNAMKQARSMKVTTIGLTGEWVGKIDEHCDYLVKVPDADTPRIQEVHILLGHIICQLVERELFGEDTE